MTHEEILAWWALSIAVFGILAHIPLTMLAHWLLPKIENYRASRSRDKLTKRIAKLQHRLAQLNDPKYFEDIEWIFRENLFFVMYLLGAGLIAIATSLFLAVGAVQRGNWFWDPSVLHLSNRLPEITAAFFFAALMIAGSNIYKSSSLRPSKRPKLRSDLQAQIDILKGKLNKFGT